jgi:LysR family glycine cleavage system transcriptional activator
MSIAAIADGPRDGARSAQSASKRPPGRRMPPLNALRSFEAAARHLSIVRAADELNVTPAAVSHQVKVLERFLGVTLLDRTNRTLILTEAGQACLPDIHDFFKGLADAIGMIGTIGRSGVLTVSVAPSFAAKWLLPRLHRFQTANPDIDVRVSASMELVDFGSADVDLSIRYGGGNYPGLLVERLLNESVFPVCSPKLLEGRPGLRDPGQLRHHTLLHDDSPDDDESCPTWEMWLRAAGVRDVDHTRGPRFNQSSLVLEAAVLGRGVALAKSAIAAADLAAGTVVKPFELSFPVGFAHYLVCPAGKAKLPKVGLFRDWLKRDAEAGD